MECTFILERPKPRSISKSSYSSHILSKTFISASRITNLIFADEDIRQSRKTTVRVEIQDVLLLSQWGMQLKEANKKSIHLSVIASAQALPGDYDVIVGTESLDSSGETAMYRCKNRERIYLV